MVEYIEREEAIALLEEKQRGICPLGRCSRNAVYGTDRDLYDAIDSDIDALLNIPAADVVPVVHGRWVYPLGMAWSYVCSECGKSIGVIKHNYCPNCGARMDGE